MELHFCTFISNSYSSHSFTFGPLLPVRAFKGLLFKCCQCMDFINFFVEKFYSCYRDGLDGGRGMRSFASLYFFACHG